MVFGSTCFFFYFQSVTGTAIKIKKKRDETEKNFLN